MQRQRSGKRTHAHTQLSQKQRSILQSENSWRRANGKPPVYTGVNAKYKVLVLRPRPISAYCLNANMVKNFIILWFYFSLCYCSSCCCRCCCSCCRFFVACFIFHLFEVFFFAFYVFRVVAASREQLWCNLIHQFKWYEMKTCSKYFVHTIKVNSHLACNKRAKSAQFMYDKRCYCMRDECL